MDRQKRRKKSRAKMAGVKSTFVVGQELLMTSFGERDTALLEKQIQQCNVESLRNPEAYGASCVKKDIVVTNAESKLRVKLNNPLAVGKHRSPEAAEYAKKVAEHKNFLKQKYEEIVFGEPYNDNIHIQVISKILDIEKTFSYVMGNIVYSINNLDCMLDIENPIDYMIESKRTDDSLRNLLPRCMYLFDLGFEYPKIDKEKKSAEQRKQEKAPRDQKNIETLKNALSFIAYIRNDSFHGFDSYCSKKAIVLPTRKYNLEKCDYKETFNQVLNNKLNKIKKDYLANSEVNINFLAEVLYGRDYTDEQEQNLSNEYFNFAILKQYKNCGFSITSLREQLLLLYKMSFEDKGNLRPRVNSFCDFVLFDYYKNHSSEALELVNKLRMSVDEKEKQVENEKNDANEEVKVYIKEQVYIGEAKRISGGLMAIFRKIGAFDCESIKNYRGSVNKISCKFPFEQEPSINQYAREKADYFCNMVYYLTQFLDGKEINIFLTSLHNIFENIASFLDVMYEQNISYKFTDEYIMFSDSAYIVKKLETVISVARMKKSLDFFNHQSLVDAINVLGISNIHADLCMSDYITNYMFGGVGPEESSEAESIDHSLRNFLVTNVIHSRKFNYLARYCNLSNVSKFAKNEVLVEYVLRRIDPKQIDRYYESTCGDFYGISYDSKIKKLVEVVSDINIDKFENINNAEISKESTANKKTVRERNNARACIGLYLNVLYQIVKNLMYINGRYAIAFAMTERDMIVEGIIKKTNNKNKQEVKPEYISLTKKYFDEGYIKCVTDRIKENIKKFNGDKKTLDHIPGGYLTKNKESYCEDSTRTFRNAVDHLVLMVRAPEYVADVSEVSSYFALYHYCMQKHILYCAERWSKTGNEKLTYALLEAKHHHSYSKDAVKYLCLPFAYNLPRYKALTIEGLFDWSEYGINDK